MIKQIKDKENLLAIIVTNDFTCEGIKFFTPDEFSQQLAFMKHPKGKIIPPHVHNEVNRNVLNTLEVLFLKKGKLRIDFYSDKRSYIESQILNSGDIILLSSGGHGFEVLEEIEMFEVKQGPYAGDKDKTRFGGIKIKDIRFNKDEQQ